MWVVEGRLWGATVHHGQVADLHQHFEQGDVEPEDFVGTVDVLCWPVSPDIDNVSDKDLGLDDVSSDGVVLEGFEEVRRKQRGKARKETEEWESSSNGVLKFVTHLHPFVNLSLASARCMEGKHACDHCWLAHVKCSLVPQSMWHLLKVKLDCVAEAATSLGHASIFGHIHLLSTNQHLHWRVAAAQVAVFWI
jgi:hypothetical protein